jgi:hypothetical protein
VRVTWAVLALAMAFALVVGWRSASAYGTTDFHCFWTAARMLGDRADPYDETAWTVAVGGPFVDPSGFRRPAPCPGRFGYPLTTAVAFVPLAALPESSAAYLWETLLVVASFVGGVLVWRAIDGPPRALATFLIVVYASEPFWLTTTTAQFGGVMLGLIGLLAFSMSRRREVTAGVAAIALLVKPHLTWLAALLAIVPGIARGSRRLLLTVLVSAGVPLGLSIALQPSWIAEWLGELLSNRREMLPDQATAWALAFRVFGDERLGAILIVAVLATVAAVLRRARLRPVDALGLATAGSLLITPYAGSHDQLVLALPWAIVFAAALRAGDRVLLAGLLLFASLLPWAIDAYSVSTAPGEPAAWIAVAATVILLAAALARSERTPS